MKSFATSTVIHTAAERVWSILVDAAGYPNWNTTVTAVDGTIALGKKITVHAKISPGRAFPVRVTTLEAPRRMVWTGGMPLGMFKGERVFELASTADGAVDFRMEERFTGPMASLITRSIPDLQPAFDEFAACLKAAAERG